MSQLLGARATCDFMSDLKKMANETISMTDIASMIRVSVEI